MSIPYQNTINLAGFFRNLTLKLRSVHVLVAKFRLKFSVGMNRSDLVGGWHGQDFVTVLNSILSTINQI